MARSQADRKAETRGRLLAAAAELFGREGFHATSTDTVGDEADRTSGAVYAHFGSKEGLVLALLDEMKDATAAAISADLARAETTDERVAALWRQFADPPADRASWVLLEHELWLYSVRNPEEGGRLAERYAAQRALLAEELQTWDGANASGGRAARDSAVLVLAVLLGLEMQRRLDPAAVTDELAIGAIRALLDPASSADDLPRSTPTLTGSSHGAD